VSGALIPSSSHHSPGSRPLPRHPSRKSCEPGTALDTTGEHRTCTRTAKIVGEEYGGRLPAEESLLVALPGIGKATAAAILAFAYNRPSLLIETNIRRLFLHWFFPLREVVSDREIIPIVSATLDRENPRVWYYALMDLGYHLRSIKPDPNKRSVHYHRQTTFRGSDREIRGRIISALLRESSIERSVLQAAVMADCERVGAICDKMVREGLLAKEGEWFRIP